MTTTTILAEKETVCSQCGDTLPIGSKMRLVKAKGQASFICTRRCDVQSTETAKVTLQISPKKPKPRFKKKVN